jgi:DNA-damage-inducible protein J
MPSNRSQDTPRRRLPFAVKVPNATTRRAMAELEQGRGKRFDSAETLFEDLDI